MKSNTFVTDFGEFQRYGDVRMRYFGVAPQPARPSVLFNVLNLVLVGLLVVAQAR